MGGGKPKKPLSAMDKRRRRATQSTKRRSKEERLIAYHDISDSLIKKAVKVIQGMELITPYTLANALNVKLSLARRMIRLLAEEGAIRIVDKSRALIIAVPRSTVKASSS